MAVPLLAPLIFPLAQVSARSAPNPPPPLNGEWVDKAHILYNGAVFTDGDISNTDNKYLGETDQGCDNEIFPVIDQANQNGAPSPASLKIHQFSQGGDHCPIVPSENTVFPININKPENKFVTAYRFDDNRIYMPYIKVQNAVGEPLAPGGVFSKLPQSDPLYATHKNIYLFEGKNDKDSQWIELDDGATSGQQFGRSCVTDQDPGAHPFPCATAGPLGVELANGGKPTAPNAQVYPQFNGQIPPAGSTNNNNSSGGGPQTECEKSLSNPLSWLMCPLVDAGVLAVKTLDNAITQELTIKTDSGCSVYDEKGKDCADPNNAPGKALFSVWAAFRSVALALLVIIGLVMIISQALSFGVFDAYTIKKVLPKILIGVIGISLSWYLCKFAIDLFNWIGLGVRSLLYAPFKDVGSINFSSDKGLTTLFTIGTGVFVLGLGLVGILSFVATALMAVAIAFGTLIFRQILIMLLVVTAPVAIVCWILPNTEKAWKMWWDFFTRALVVFPIISLFIAGGRVIAQLATLNATAAGSSAGNGLLAQAAPATGFLSSVIAFVAYFGPYFALPAAFRLAGGAIATVGGVVNDRGKGAFDRLKNFRGERRKQRVENFRNAGHYNTDTRRGRFGNKVGGWVFDADERLPYHLGKGGRGPFGKRGMQLASKIEHAQKEQTVEMMKGWNNTADVNDKTFAAVGGSLSDLSPETREEFIKKGLTTTDQHGNVVGSVLDTQEKFDKAKKILAASNDSTERIAANGLSRIQSSVLNRHRDGQGYASVAGAAMLGLSAHGFGSEESMVEMANKIKADSGGHNDFAESMLVFSEVNGSSGRKAGYSHSVDKQGNFITGTQAGRNFARVSSKNYQAIGGLKKKEAVRDVKDLLGIAQYAQTDDAGRATLREKWMKDGLKSGMSKEDVEASINNRTDGFNSVSDITDTSLPDHVREDAAKAHQAFMEKAHGVDATLYGLTGPVSGAAGDTLGAVQQLINENSSLVNIGGSLSDEDKMNIDASRNMPSGGQFGGAGGLGSGGVGPAGLS